MTFRRWFVPVSAALIFVSPAARACSCAPPPPPCQAYPETPMVFLGTVTEVLAVRDGRVVRARMRVDHGYKGVSVKSLVLFDDGWCDGPELRVGEQYVMYTSRQNNGEVPSRGCTRSRHVKYAAEDIEYLNGLPAAPATAAISGRIMNRTSDFYGNDRPLPGVQVEVTGPDGKQNVAADTEGRYSLTGLEPGEYAITARHPGYRLMIDGPAKVSVAAQGCAVVTLIFRKQYRGAIQGTVVRWNGAPAPPGLSIELLRLETWTDGRQQFTFSGVTVRTNDKGEYSFDEVAPGRYKIAAHRHAFPTARLPYPTIYWPAAHSESEASVIEVGEEGLTQRCDFTLPIEPKSARVKGIVLSATGEPLAGVQIHVVALPDNSIGDDDQNRPVSDAEGKFSFTALGGFEYRVSASSDTLWMHAADFPFTLGRGPQFVSLRLDRRGRFDNDPAEPPGAKP